MERVERGRMSIGRILLMITGILTVCFLVAPTLIVIPMSIGPSPILEFPPSGFTLRWYQGFFLDRFWTESLRNSLTIGFLTALLASILGTLAAYGLVRGTFPGKRIVSGILIAPLIVPVVIVALGMFSVFVRWKLTGNIIGLLVAHTTMSIPFVVVMVSTSLRTIDRNLELAARSLGAGRLKTFSRITLPLALPGIAAGALFAFITSWDEVVAALFLTTARFKTIPVQMWSQLSERVDPTVAAVSTMLLVVTTTLTVIAIVLRKGQIF